MAACKSAPAGTTMVAARAVLLIPARRISTAIVMIDVKKDGLNKRRRERNTWNIFRPHFGSRTISGQETPGFADPHRYGGAVIG